LTAVHRFIMLDLMDNPEIKTPSVFKRLKTFFSTATYGRTIGFIGLAIVIAAIPLTVFIAQKQQEIRQHAATSASKCGDCTCYSQKVSCSDGSTIDCDWKVCPDPNNSTSGPCECATMSTTTTSSTTTTTTAKETSTSSTTVPQTTTTYVSTSCNGICAPECEPGWKGSGTCPDTGSTCCLKAKVTTTTTVSNDYKGCVEMNCGGLVGSALDICAQANCSITTTTLSCPKDKPSRPHGECVAATGLCNISNTCGVDKCTGADDCPQPKYKCSNGSCAPDPNGTMTQPECSKACGVKDTCEGTCMIACSYMYKVGVGKCVTNQQTPTCCVSSDSSSTTLSTIATDPNNPNDPITPTTTTTQCPWYNPWCSGTTTTVPGGNTLLALNVGLDGLGTTGDNLNSSSVDSNKNPKHTTRSALVKVFDKTGAEKVSATGTVDYISSSGKFTGTIGIPNFTETGEYTVKVKADGFLTKLYSGIQTITKGATKTMALVTLVNGDINNDNAITVLDYNLLINCSSFNKSKISTATAACSTTYQTLADLDDNGTIDQYDVNLFIREFSAQSGD
jgi:hypothetical protein